MTKDHSPSRGWFEDLSRRVKLTGDPYFTDGMQAVAVLSRTPTAPTLLTWSTNAMG
jgi:hypothetical protein